MKHAAWNLIGALAGMALGWLVVATPLAAMFAPVRVSWDATGCPAGVYSITSTAQRFGTGETFVVTSSGVTLPRPTFIQEFANLSPGAYSVTATVIGSDGAMLGTATQTVTSGEFGPGHRRPPVASTLSRSRPGNNGHQRRASTQSSSAGPMYGSGGTSSIQVSQPVIPGSREKAPERSGSELSRLVELAADWNWRRLEIVDADDDGQIDRVTIEMANGDVYVWSGRAR